MYCVYLSLYIYIYIYIYTYIYVYISVHISHARTYASHKPEPSDVSNAIARECVRVLHQ